jgi:hypothetical protein
MQTALAFGFDDSQRQPGPELVATASDPPFIAEVVVFDPGAGLAPFVESVRPGLPRGAHRAGIPVRHPGCESVSGQRERTRGAVIPRCLSKAELALSALSKAEEIFL